MSTAFLDQLPPIITDVDWAFDFVFEEADGSPHAFNTSDNFAVELKSKAVAGQVLLAATNGSWAYMGAPNTVSARLPASAFAAIATGDWAGELVRIGSDGARELLTVFEVTAFVGASVAAGVGVTPIEPDNYAGGSAVVNCCKVVYPASGPIGPAGPAQKRADVSANPRVITALDNNYILVWRGSGLLEAQLAAGLPDGFTCRIVKAGAGDVRVTGQDGVTVEAPNNFTRLSTKFEDLVISQIATNELLVSRGDAGGVGQLRFNQPAQSGLLLLVF